MTLLLLLLGCTGDPKCDEGQVEDADGNCVDAETGDTSETGETGDSSDTGDTSDTSETGETAGTDADGDGYTVDEGDCNDADEAIHPGVTDECDEIDNDCDDAVDEDAAYTTYFRDTDGDGYGDPESFVDACARTEGLTKNSSDCNDADADVNPNADETCNDVDDDCDGSVDEDATDGDTFYPDADGDGQGADAGAVDACDAPEGHIAVGGDCDDGEATVYSGAPEVCDTRDNDCDGSVDEDATDGTTYYTDADGDRYGDSRTGVAACTAPSGTVATGGDCNDADSGINPGAAEVCDEVDQDCDGYLDEDAIDPSTFYADNDGDGFGNDAGAVSACRQPGGTTATGGDCNDSDALVNPDATEVCNGFDDDCDTDVDGGATDAATWFADLDGDRYGDASTGTEACTAPRGYIGDDGDCDDTNAGVNPGATEVCNGADDDCDSVADDGASDTTEYYRDADGDGHGDPALPMDACSPVAGYVALDDDCNDGDAAYYPGATESCDDTVDYNCDGSIGYSDGDGDGVAACLDCDDTSASVKPGATEVCDGVDNNCDGTIDTDAVGAATWYADTDRDGYGDDGSFVEACTPPLGFVATPGDCDDTTAATSPGATERCDGDDNDCDGTIDEDARDAVTWFVDGDADGFGDSSTATTDCAPDAGSASVGGDCDDAEATAYPGAVEVCDDLDNDCDSGIDENAVDAQAWYSDADGDGYGTDESRIVACNAPPGSVNQGGDCDDASTSARPGLPEVCDDQDNDCDGAIDDAATDAGLWYTDADGDSYGDDGTAVVTCDPATGAVGTGGDCDDASNLVYPGAEETCDRLDNDCDGETDDGWRACYDTGIVVAWYSGSAEVDAAGTFVSGSFGNDYTAYGALPDLESLCNIEGAWATSGRLRTPCPDCDWSFSLGVSGSTPVGDYCDDFGLDTSTGFDGFVGGWGFSETYDYVYGANIYTLDTVVWYFARTYGAWIPFSYNYAGYGYNEGDRYSMNFHAYTALYSYYYPYP